MIHPTPKQVPFFLDLMKDVRALFFEKALAEGRHVEIKDYVAWLGGVFNKSGIMEEAYYEKPYDFRWAFLGLDSGKARQVIKLLSDLRKRMDTAAPREDVKTQPHLLKALWTAARRNGIDNDAVREIIHDITKGATQSTRHLKRGEALEALRRVNGEVTVFERREKGGWRKRRQTVV